MEIGEIFKQNLGDSGAKLWSGANRTLAPLASALAPPTRRAAATVMTLNPAMSQQEMDTFLDSLGASHNPFSVQGPAQQIFDRRALSSTVFRRTGYVRWCYPSPPIRHGGK